jgi:hypothetical protein
MLPHLAYASPHFQRADSLQTICAATDQPAMVIKCMSYVAGVVDAITSYSVVEGSAIPFCLPPNTTLEQLTVAVSRFLTDHPEKWRYAGSDEVLGALHTDFPCT